MCLFTKPSRRCARSWRKHASFDRISVRQRVASATLFFLEKASMGSPKNQILEQVEKLSGPVLQEHQAELVDLQWVHEHGSWVLRFFLDKAGGITLDDCASLSDHIGRVLDETDVIPQSYSLEVSSPGVYRPLKKEKDFLKYKGQPVDITLFAPLNGRRHFKGTIEGFQNGVLALKDIDGASFSLPLADMAKVNLDPEIEI